MVFVTGISTEVGPWWIIEPWSVLLISNSTGGKIDCKAGGEPPPSVTWKFADGKPLSITPGLIDVLENGTLRFLPFHPSAYRHDVHAATYRCVARNTAGAIISRDVRVKAGPDEGNIIFESSAKEVDYSFGLTPDTSDIVLETTTNERHSRLAVGLLVLCAYAGCQGGVEQEPKILVLQNLELKVEAAQSYHRGNTAVLKCIVPSFMKEFISITSWLQDSSFNVYPSPRGDGKYHMLPTGELLIRRLEDADMYRGYQCRAINRLTGQTLLSLHRVRFLITDSLAQAAPKIQELPSTVHTKKDQTVVLPCFAQGNPPPTYTWLKSLVGGGEIEVLPGGRVESAGEALILERAELSDIGIWTCIANSTMGSHKKSFTLLVAVPLSVTLHPSGQTMIDVGEYFELKCVVTGGQRPSVTWLKDTNIIMSPGSGNIFSINKVGRDDAGMYQCLVKDEEGSFQAAVQLILGAAQPQLLYRFIQQTVQPGPAMSLKCIAAGNPTPHITWTLDGFSLPTNNERFVIGQYVTIHGDVISHVNISNVHVLDGGIYRCKASNRVGEVSHSAAMRVYGLPHIRPMPNISAVAGEPLYLACPVAGYPIESIIWAKGERKLPLSRRQRVFSNGTLYIASVEREQDQGMYRCSAQNKQGKSSSQEVSISVIVPPRIAPFVLQSDLHVGDRVGVQCFVTKGDMPLEIGWKKDSGPISPDVSVRQYGQYTSSLSINSLTPEHAGNYTCFARNDAATAMYTAQLLVNVPPKLGPFTFGELIEGVRTQVQCVVQAGDPPLTLRWLKDDLKISSDLGIQITNDDYSSTLAIGRVGSEHAGDYTCIASNPAKSTKLTSRLIVSVPPKWRVEPRDVNITREGVAVFECVAEGFPTPTTTWKKIIAQSPSEYQDLDVGRLGYFIFENGTLMIKPALVEHQGQYLCEASNGIGSGISATVTLVVNNPPDFEMSSSQESVRRGQTQVLVCEARGDHPLAIIWSKYSSSQLNSRYEVREKHTLSGMISELVIENSVKSDSGQYACTATNPYGTAQRTVSLQVQDAPSKPIDVRLAEIGSRSLKVSWVPPPDEQVSKLQYSVHYKRGSGMIIEGWETVAAGSETHLTLNHLHPATVYSIKVQAENQLGAGEPSDIIQVTTSTEAPSGEPQGFSVTTKSSTELSVSWMPPPLHTHNGDLVGYHVGYREYNGGPPNFFNFTSVNASPTGDTLILGGLSPYRKYGVVVQAFNHKGTGPITNEFIAHTSEDVPGAPPSNIQCISQSSQSIVVSWKPPPPLLQNGRIQGYRLYYENQAEFPPGFVEAETRVTSEQSVNLHGLQRFSNYSIQVWAFTKVGDGEKSDPIFCMTDEDVPESPAGIKVLSNSMSSLTVSWLPPYKPNGRIAGYYIYWKTLEGGKDRDPEKKRVSASTNHYQISQLSKSGTYELWVAALTKAGEGKHTHVVYATPSNRGAAGIISFGGLITVMVGTPVTMPCLVTGNPTPNRVWSPKPLPQNTQFLPDGSLFIPSVQRVHQRNYTCMAVNPPGSEEITYVLQVIVSPAQPSLVVTETGPDWLEIHWSVADNGGSAIRGYVLEYVLFSAESPPWVETTLSRDKNTYRLSNLSCGRQYHIKIAAFNAAGVGLPSILLTAQTDGGKPVKPGYTDFLSGNMSSVTLNLNAWNSNSCPIQGFNIEYKETSHSDWLVVGKNVEGKEKFDIVGLWPGRKYKIRVKAHNSAGEMVGEYSFTTLPNLGVTLSPTSVKISDVDSLYLEPNVILPVVASMLTLVSIGAAITICFRRKRDMASRNCNARQRHHSETQGMVTMDNKSNLAQREQFYAAMHKGMATPVHDLQCENIPEYPDDISPYATFHVATQQVNTPQHIHNFVYHDQALAAMETMPLKSKLKLDNKGSMTRTENVIIKFEARGSAVHRPWRTEVSVRSTQREGPLVKNGGLERGARPHRPWENREPLGNSRNDDYSKLRGGSKSSKCLSAGSDYSGSTDQWSEQGIMSRPERIPLHLYGSNSVRTGDSSSSPENSPVHERRLPVRHKHNPRKEESTNFGYPRTLEPPTGFNDGNDISDAECDMESIHRLKPKSKGFKNKRDRRSRFTIAV